MLTHSTLCSHVYIKVHYETFNTQKTNRYGISKKGFVIHVTIEMKNRNVGAIIFQNCNLMCR